MERGGDDGGTCRELFSSKDARAKRDICEGVGPKRPDMSGGRAPSWTVELTVAKDEGGVEAWAVGLAQGGAKCRGAALALRHAGDGPRWEGWWAPRGSNSNSVVKLTFVDIPTSSSTFGATLPTRVCLQCRESFTRWRRSPGEVTPCSLQRLTHSRERNALRLHDASSLPTPPLTRTYLAGLPSSPSAPSRSTTRSSR